MALEIVIGVGIVCFLFLYLAFKLSSEHKYLQLFVVGIFIFMVLLVPKTLIDDKDNCQIVLNGTYESYQYGNNFTGYHWDYDFSHLPGVEGDAYLFHKWTVNTYRWECFTEDNKTTDTFYYIAIWSTAIMFIYLFGYFVAWKLMFQPLLKLGQKRDYGKNKNR